MHHVPLAFEFIIGCSDERGENGDLKEEREIHGEMDRMEMVGRFFEVCRRRGLKVMQVREI